MLFEYRNEEIFYSEYDTPAGKIEIGATEKALVSLRFGKSNRAGKFESPICAEAYRQLTEYFAGRRRNFDLPLEIKGTEFQERVWNELLKIPYGETRSYKDIAESVGNPKAARAVGMANNKNPIAIIIPCHRVTAANCSAGGYAYGTEIKEILLGIEER